MQPKQIKAPTISVFLRPCSLKSSNLTWQASPGSSHKLPHKHQCSFLRQFKHTCPQLVSGVVFMPQRWPAAHLLSCTCSLAGGVGSTRASTLSTSCTLTLAPMP